ncbi:MAG TPA: archease [Candidatus Eisenbacteria bacterium]|nr:archease [Candidatus Eisenbacteria bacterium]
MPYEFLEDVAIADIAFRSWAKDLEGVFIESGNALTNVMVEDLESIEAREERAVRAENDALDMLLFDFLGQLIYFKDAEKLLLRALEVKVIQRDGRFALDARLAGEPIDVTRHRLRVDVKAVTLHQFRLEKTDDEWQAFVILDI